MMGRLKSDQGQPLNPVAKDLTRLALLYGPAVRCKLLGSISPARCFGHHEASRARKGDKIG
jgi:hypothetical protein